MLSNTLDNPQNFSPYSSQMTRSPHGWISSLSLRFIETAVAHTRSPTTGLVVLHPDVLLSGTLVSGSYKCPRASVIQERFGGSSGVAAVQGTLLHELFQVG